MYKKNNSASRVHALLSRAVQLQLQEPTYRVWAEIFGVRGENDLQTAKLVSARLVWLHEEIELLRIQVRSTNFSSQLYESAFDRVENVLSPLNLAAGWSSIRGNIPAEVLQSFHFCNEILPDEESLIPTAELRAILDEVEELRGLLSHSSLSDHLQRFVNHQIDLIVLAVAQYPIRGAKALREGANTALGEIIQTKDAILAEKSAQEVSKLRGIWTRVNNAADVAIKADRLMHIAQRTWDNFLGWF